MSDEKGTPASDKAASDATTGSEGGGTDAEFVERPTEDTEAGEPRRKSPSRVKRDVG